MKLYNWVPARKFDFDEGAIWPLDIYSCSCSFLGSFLRSCNKEHPTLEEAEQHCNEMNKEELCSSFAEKLLHKK